MTNLPDMPVTLAAAAHGMALTIDIRSSDEDPPRWWWFKVFGFKIYCYNFAWRRLALAQHDLHHLLTGYPCTLTGEMRLAAWEFAAGRYPNTFATLFCLPLLAVGALAIPWQLWLAFRSGRRSQSLFGTPITPDLMKMELSEARSRFMNHRAPHPAFRDFAAFSTFVSLSFLLFAAPLLVVWALAARL